MDYQSMSAPSQSNMRNDKAPSMGVFFSPPEAYKEDTFSSTYSPRPVADMRSKQRPADRLPSVHSLLSRLSPPISPQYKDEQETGREKESQPSTEIPDPQLYPDTKTTEQTGATSPLFKPVDVATTPSPISDVVDLHIRARNEVEHKEADLPSRQDYDLAITFRQKVTERYNANPEKYYKQELAYLHAYPPRWKSAAPVKKSHKRKMDDEERPAKRQRQAPKAMAEKLPAPKRLPRASPRDAPLNDLDSEPVIIKHRRKVSRTTPTPREDMDYRKVPDYSPPISTMAPGKNLKIDWKGHPLDLSDDPDRQLLDDHEVTLASVLRLTAAQYLFAKRKIFERFIDVTRHGGAFNKTSAQAVCKIDVNKASKLWTAFEKVGWFDRRHFAQYL